MPPKKGLKDYQEMKIRSARPENLIVMLYDGALRFLRLAIQGIEQKSIEQANNNLIKAQNILTELMASLNFDNGKEIAVNLFRIYEFMHHTLVQANLKKEAEPVRRVMEQLKRLRESWAEAVKLEQQSVSSSLPNSIRPESGQNRRIKITG